MEGEENRWLEKIWLQTKVCSQASLRDDTWIAVNAKRKKHLLAKKILERLILSCPKNFLSLTFKLL